MQLVLHPRRLRGGGSGRPFGYLLAYPWSLSRIQLQRSTQASPVKPLSGTVRHYCCGDLPVPTPALCSLPRNGGVSSIPASRSLERHCNLRRTMNCLSAARVSAVPLSVELRDGLRRLGIQKLTEVQRVCLLRSLKGSSLAVAAKPGAGKTLAYLLPILQRFVTEGHVHGIDASDRAQQVPFALILVPSRELARQVMTVATALLPHAPVFLLDPTVPLRQQQQTLKHLPAKLLIATPDRVLALMRPKKSTATAAALSAAETPVQLCLNMLCVLVVDEADALLRSDYHKKVKAIYQLAVGGKEKAKHDDANGETVQQTRESLQTLFFTAVLPEELSSMLQAEFPHVETFDLVNAPRGPGGRTDLAAKRDTLSRQSHSQGSAVAGAGLQHHICYVASYNEAHNSVNGDGRRARRTSSTTQETQLEGERKILALAEILRTHIPTAPRSSGRFTTTGSRPEGKGALEQSQDSPETNSASTASSSSQPETSEEREESAQGEVNPQCIVFADSQDEVRYVSSHPLLDGWRVVSVNSGMDIDERQRAMQSFLEGRASVLVCTDVAARGLDVPTVVLVVHMHPPSPALNYTHRAGRAGRGSLPGTSVLLCSSTELHRLRDVEHAADISFERRSLPALADCKELFLRQLILDILNVPHTEYAPLLDFAERLHSKVGVRALATVLLKLGGNSSFNALSLPSSDCRSILTGRRGFVPLLLYDPTHERLDSSMAARRFLLGLLPSAANAEAVGRIAKSANGYVADVSSTYVDHVLQEGVSREKALNEAENERNNGCSGDNVWVPVFHLDRLPRLLNQGIGRRRQKGRLPWTKMRLSLSRSKKQAHQESIAKKRVLEGDMAQLQALKDTRTAT